MRNEEKNEKLLGNFKFGKLGSTKQTLPAVYMKHGTIQDTAGHHQHQHRIEGSSESQIENGNDELFEVNCE